MSEGSLEEQLEVDLSFHVACVDLSCIDCNYWLDRHDDGGASSLRDIDLQQDYLADESDKMDSREPFD